MTPKTSAASNTLGVFATRLATFPLTILTSIFVARILGPADLGVYRFLLLLGSFVLPVMSLGFGASIVYFLSTKRYQVGEVLLTCLAMGVIQGIANALLMGALWRLACLGETAAQVPFALMLPVLLISPLQGALLMLTRVLLGDSWFSLHNWVSLATPLVSSLSLLLLVVVLPLGLQGCVAAVVLSNVMVAGYVLSSILRRHKPTRAFHVRFALNALGYGLRAWPSDLAMRANLRLDQFLLGMLAPPAALGAYSLAVSVSELMWMLPDSLAFVLFNRMAAEKVATERTRLTGQVHRVLFVVVTAAAVAAGLGGYWLIPVVYGYAYRAACTPLLLLLPGSIAFTTTKVLSKYFGASGMPGRSSVTAVAGAGVGVSLYFLLIPRFGIGGAAAASSASYVTMSVIAFCLYRRLASPEPTKLFAFGAGDLSWAKTQLKGAVAAWLGRVA